MSISNDFHLVLNEIPKKGKKNNNTKQYSTVLKHNFDKNREQKKVKLSLIPLPTFLKSSFLNIAKRESVLYIPVYGGTLANSQITKSLLPDK